MGVNVSEQKPKITEQDVRAETLSAATGWLLQNGLINNNVMKSTIMLNIYKVSERIKNVELMIDLSKEKMLILIELDGFGRLFKKRIIASNVMDMMQEALPTYEFRITYDPKLFELSQTRYKEFLAKAEVQRRKRIEEEKKKKAETKKEADEKASQTKPNPEGDAK